jgi:hypothetical protein
MVDQPTNPTLTDNPDPSVEIITATRAAASSWGRAHGKVRKDGKGNQNPGANAYMGPSSLTPGQKADPAAIDAGGSPNVPADDWQTRGVDAKQQVGTAHGLVRQQTDMATISKARLPGKNGASPADDFASRRATCA